MDEKKPTEQFSSDSKSMAALSYIPALSIVMLILKKNDQFVQFHARQGLVLSIAFLVIIIPVLGWFLALVISIVDLIGFLKALAGERYSMPLIGPLAEKIKL